ncbi:hypothetical protein [uncultured Rikenella sp.]|uniref:hypothetical protein n=1 Tax=uncultured Rikenella sp. TaxID=368003 RepID=UPI0025FE51AF|nr:hypothetical protein [uncultured Rikenella sp.]
MAIFSRCYMLVFIWFIGRRAVRLGSAPGFRYNAPGVLGYSGNHGYQWSSAVSDIKGTLFGFSMERLETNGPSSRGNALQLRCLSE